MPSGFGTRAVSSIAVVAVAAAVVLGPHVLVGLILLGLGIVGVLEMYGLLSRSGRDLPAPLGVGLVVLLILASIATVEIRPRTDLFLDLAIFAALLAPLLYLLSKGPEPGGLQRWAFASGGALYVGWPLLHFELLRGLPHGRGWAALVVLCTWASDTGAYMVGSYLGRHQLAPAISPGKTVEGSVGAAALTVITGVIVAAVAGLPVPLGWIAAASLLLSALAQAGDLAESYVKRLAGAKDSGTLIPGHGGLLDRIDSLLWVVVAVYYIAVAAL